MNHRTDTAGLAAFTVTPATQVASSSQQVWRNDFPTLVEGHRYLVEFIDDELTRKGTLTHFSEHPLGVGASFLFGKRRRFVYLDEIHHVAGDRICIMGSL